MPDEQIETKSAIPKIEIPKDGFQSSIPQYLLSQKTDAEIFILTEISKFNHYAEWSSKILVDVNEQVRYTNGRVSRLEKFRDSILSWKVVVFAIISCLGGLIVTAIEIYKIFHP